MFDAWIRKIVLNILGRTEYPKALAKSRRQAVKVFKSTARRVSAYRTLLLECGIDPDSVNNWEDFQKLPTTGKHNTFQRFSLEQLCLPGTLDQLAGVLTSSGQSGNFAFGLTTRKQAKSANFMIDLGLEATFEVDRYKTLLLNALPMGVGFTSNAVTVAETSVREDMVLALADKFGPYFEQIVLVTDPVFLKLLCDTSRDRGFDWKRFRVHAVIGEETIGENFRSYVGHVLGTDPDDYHGPILGASMGAGELGLNLFFETPQTIALRRLLCKEASLRQQFFGVELTAEQVPMLFTYSTAQICVECLPDEKAPTGYGQLTITPLAKDAPLPLLRYQTGDLIRIYPPDALVQMLVNAAQPHLRRWNMPVVALRGRDSEETGAANVSTVKDSLYRNRELADALTAAFRLETDNGALRLHLQMRSDALPPADFEARLRAELPESVRTASIKLWPYAAFPFGMRLDYERKFKYV
jgi:phenylacetate-CoA ligase